MKDLMDKWTKLKNEERIAKEAREDIEAELFLALKDEMNGDSQSTWNYDNYKLVIKPNYSVKVDQELAAECPEMFKVKYEMSYSQYKKCTENINDIVTINQTKPSFTVEIK